MHRNSKQVYKQKWNICYYDNWSVISIYCVKDLETHTNILYNSSTAWSVAYPSYI